MVTIEDWAYAYIVSTTLADKLAPPPAPAANAFAAPRAPLRVPAPGRPPELVVTSRAKKAPKSFTSPRKRAEILHRFFHHELQAAELMAWAILAFPTTPPAFRRGLLQIAQDEIRHANLYHTRIRELGCTLRDFPVRDWFWQRIPSCATPLSFCAVMGMGFESANLDHAQRYEHAFRAAGDHESAELQARVADEEIPHVRFAMHWFAQLSGAPLSFEAWQAQLPPPLSPWVMRGMPLAEHARTRAGQSAEFLRQLAAYAPQQEPPTR